MSKALSLLTKGAFWAPYSRYTRLVAKAVYGVNFSSSNRFQGSLSLQLASSTRPSVIVGDDNLFLGDIDLRTRDEATLTLGSRLKLDGPVRIVAAGSSGIFIGDDTRITCYTIMNGGGNIHIGRGVIIGPRSTINANEHNFRSRTPVIEAGFTHVDIWIGDDVWLGSDVAVLPGACLAKGTVVGANSVIRGETEPYSVYAGSPARKVGQR